MKPPSTRDAGFTELVARVIASRPEGVSFDRLAVETSIFPGELASITKSLRDQRLIEVRDDGKLHIRQRKKKPAPAPSFWQRLKNVFAL
jgi:hypothetical protein